MSEVTSVLLIDDDRFVHKIVKRALEPAGFHMLFAANGEDGISEAIEHGPDIILLDVEMPGLTGYEVCVRLRDEILTQEIPVVFLSSHSSLNERLQGYEVGADDYLTKPFENENLVARINVLSKYRKDREEMRAQYKMAQETALIAMSGTSEIAVAMQYMERTIVYKTAEQTIEGLLSSFENLSLDCCLAAEAGDDILWQSSEGVVSPLEKELMLMSDKTKRFLDFGCRTVVHFSAITLLVRNMPLDDMNRYGRLKDLIPFLLSAANTKLTSLQTQRALTCQSIELKKSFSGIRTNLFGLAKVLVENRKKGTALTEDKIQALVMNFLSMGLESEDEAFLIKQIESSMWDLQNEMDVGKEFKDSLTFILQNLESTISQYGSLVDEFIENQNKVVEVIDSPTDDNVELF